MKITSVECLILDNQFPFVFIETDEGIIGLGECFRRQPEVTKTVVENILAPAIIGKDPVNTDQRFQDMVSVGNALEIGGAIWIAIAGLDIAMWDIKVNLSIYQSQIIFSFLLSSFSFYYSSQYPLILAAVCMQEPKYLNKTISKSKRKCT